MVTQNAKDGKLHVVILGGGFGGLYAAKDLAAAPVGITIIDRSNHHLFQPLLYQVATAAVSPGDIARPIRAIFRNKPNVKVLMSEATRVDVPNRKVILVDGEISYDYLIVATGATHAYFGHRDWAAIAPGLKTLEDAIEIRRLFLTAFEEAEKENDPERRSALLTFVIIGAGPTGVELAGTMSEVAKRTLVKDFRKIDPKEARILLLEGSPRVLPQYPERLSASAARQLIHLGVEIRTGTMVTGLEPGAVYLGDEKIRTERVFWAAGVAASAIGQSLGAPVDRFGRVIVQPDLAIKGHPEVSVIGDLAAVTDSNGKQVPGVAPAAIQMGRYVAKKIRSRLQGISVAPFAYRDKGSLATIGRAAAVGYFGKRQISGLFAWLAWLFIHIYFLIGFRNRIFVVLNWAWTYLSFQSGARLITYYDWSTQGRLACPPPAVIEASEVKKST